MVPVVGGRIDLASSAEVHAVGRTADAVPGDHLLGRRNASRRRRSCDRCCASTLCPARCSGAPRQGLARRERPARAANRESSPRPARESRAGRKRRRTWSAVCGSWLGPRQKCRSLGAEVLPSSRLRRSEPVSQIDFCCMRRLSLIPRSLAKCMLDAPGRAPRSTEFLRSTSERRSPISPQRQGERAAVPVSGINASSRVALLPGADRRRSRV